MDATFIVRAAAVGVIIWVIWANWDYITSFFKKTPVPTPTPSPTPTPVDPSEDVVAFSDVKFLMNKFVKDKSQVGYDAAKECGKALFPDVSIEVPKTGGVK